MKGCFSVNFETVCLQRISRVFNSIVFCEGLLVWYWSGWCLSCSGAHLVVQHLPAPHQSSFMKCTCWEAKKEFCIWCVNKNRSEKVKQGVKWVSDWLTAAVFELSLLYFPGEPCFFTVVYYKSFPLCWLLLFSQYTQKEHLSRPCPVSANSWGGPQVVSSVSQRASAYIYYIIYYTFHMTNRNA